MSGLGFKLADGSEPGWQDGKLGYHVVHACSSLRAGFQDTLPSNVVTMMVSWHVTDGRRETGLRAVD